VDFEEGTNGGDHVPEEKRIMGEKLELDVRERKAVVICRHVTEYGDMSELTKTFTW
jgi:hypothetical protein